jgi:hypothetical protein
MHANTPIITKQGILLKDMHAQFTWIMRVKVPTGSTLKEENGLRSMIPHVQSFMSTNIISFFLVL